MPPIRPGQRVSVLDPACGDGRFLAAAAEHVAAAGGAVSLHGVDIDAGERRRGAPRRWPGSATCASNVGDALDPRLGRCRLDVVLGNPPYLSQLAAATIARRGERARRRPVRRRRRRVPRPRRRPRHARRRTRRARAAAVDPRLARRRTGAGDGRATGRTGVVVVVAALPLRRPGPRVRRRLPPAREPAPRRRRPRTRVDRRRDRSAGRPRRAGARRRRLRSATAPR